MYKTQKNEKGFYFIMEYCETDLAKLLKKEIFLPEELAIKYFKQIIEGIKYIYEKNAFHRDLKVLLHSFFSLKTFFSKMTPSKSPISGSSKSSTNSTSNANPVEIATKPSPK